ncbi:MAG: hypothetical protein JO078_03680 [Candidatus Eremiobacteraeota bacterium]|nr:hypothetical protein [Candidatus Eremiobacteraeota bacterium]MBV9055706.1 hypothetical protein [Candidatus Eremiobacteraeota bacterium]MBV9699208.1 hypothetical protein [Candidatus Eremiobacteraeota bacterium]
MFVPLSRLFTLAMAAVLCFALLVPMSLRVHKPALAIAVAIVFIAYLIANVATWQRMRPPR